MGCHFLLQGIFPTQGLNPGLSHCWQTLYRLSYQGSPASHWTIREIPGLTCFIPLLCLYLWPSGDPTSLLRTPSHPAPLSSLLRLVHRPLKPPLHWDPFPTQAEVTWGSHVTHSVPLSQIPQRPMDRLFLQAGILFNCHPCKYVGDQEKQKNEQLRELEKLGTRKE